MSDLNDVKERIYSDNKIEDILTELGCWGIDTEQKGKLVVAGLPDGDNPRSVQVKNNPSLGAAIRSKGIVGSIFDVISFILYEADTEEKRKSALHKSKYWVCQKYDYYEFIDEFYKATSDPTDTKKNYNKWLRNVRSEDKNYIFEQNKVLRGNLLKEYGLCPYKKWNDEGLTCNTQREFGVGIDVRSERITFPIHNSSGELIGVKGRYCGTDKTIEDRYKYLYILPCNKSLEFFNLHRAMPEIKRKNEVLIVEGAKTVMFLHQWGYKNAISIEGDSLSDTQVGILKSLGITTKFIFAYDKDKDKAFIKDETSRLTGRMKYTIFDRKDYLVDKDSPCDKGKDIWEVLYNSHQYKLS